MWVVPLKDKEVTEFEEKTVEFVCEFSEKASTKAIWRKNGNVSKCLLMSLTLSKP